MIHWVRASDNGWQRVTKNGTTSERITTSGTASDND